MNDYDIQLQIEMVSTTTNGGTTPNGAYTTVVSNTSTPENPRGDTIVGNFELRFTAEQAFDFPGGGLIIRFSNPSAAYALDESCSQVLVNYTSSDSSGYFVQKFYKDTLIDPGNIGGFQITNVYVPTPDINVTDSVAPIDDLLIPFGMVEIGSTSGVETVTVTNDGDADLEIDSVELGSVVVPDSSKTDCEAFTINGECVEVESPTDNAPEDIVEPTSDFLLLDDSCTGQTLEPGASCTIDVQFAPQGSCHRSAELLIYSNDPDEAVVPVTLEGTAKGDFGSDIRINPYFRFYFPFIPVGESSAPQMVSLFNASSTPKSVNEIGFFEDDAAQFMIDLYAFEGPFTTPCGELPVVLQPLESCVFGMSFMPEESGPAFTTLGVFGEDECAFRDVYGRGWDYGFSFFGPKPTGR